jgi:hypothetical protein
MRPRAATEVLGDEWVLALVCVLTFFGAGRHEGRFGGHDHGVSWAVLSIAVSALVVLVLHGSWAWLLAAQVGLFIAIGVVRAARGR